MPERGQNPQIIGLEVGKQKGFEVVGLGGQSTQHTTRSKPLWGASG